MSFDQTLRAKGGGEKRSLVLRESLNNRIKRGMQVVASPPNGGKRRKFLKKRGQFQCNKGLEEEKVLGETLNVYHWHGLRQAGEP